MKQIIIFLIAVFFTVSSLAHELNSVDENCEVTYKHYDESHIAYSKKFAEMFKVDSEHIMEMPDKLHFIELIARNELGKPACYLNLVFDNSSEELKIPNEDISIIYNGVTFLSNIEEIVPSKSVEDFSSKTLFMRLVSKIKDINHSYRSKGFLSTGTIYHLNNYKDFVFISTRMSNFACSIGELLLVEKINTEIHSDEIASSYPEVEKVDKFFVTIPLPAEWVEKAKVIGSEIRKIEKKASKCRSKKHQKMKKNTN